MENESKKDTRQLILKAALSVFATKGINGARMHEIADAAGVNKATLYYYFTSKETLFLQTLYEVFDEFVATLYPKLVQSEDIFTALESLVSNYIDFIAAHPEMPPLVLGELARGGGVLLEVMPKVFASGDFNLASKIFEMIQQAIIEERLRPQDPRQTIASILGMMLFYFGARPLFKRLWEVQDDATFLEERKAAILDLLFNGIFTNSEK